MFAKYSVEVPKSSDCICSIGNKNEHGDADKKQKRWAQVSARQRALEPNALPHSLQHPQGLVQNVSRTSGMAMFTNSKSSEHS